MSIHSDSFIQQFVEHLAQVDAESTHQPNGLQRHVGADFCLVLVDGTASSVSINLRNKSDVQIGRNLENTIVVRDATCSRHHCRMGCEGGAWFIEDLYSRNGTSVNGTKIRGEYLLCNGDEIQIGKTKIQFTELPITDH